MKDASEWDDVVLEASGIAKWYGSEPVLKGASLWVQEGRVTSLFGRNGCGKSTLLSVAAGLLAFRNGAIRYRGKFIPRPRLSHLARAGLFYSDQGRSLLPSATVLEHLELVCVAFRQDLTAVQEELRQMRLSDLATSRVGDLSGGEKQRLSLAMACLRQPYCVLLDEPFAEVAPTDRQLIHRGLRRLADRGAGILITGHDVEDVLTASDGVIWMVSGTTHYLGEPAEARRHAQFRREYLGRSIDLD
jgi:ABC-type multidrug transport system ATPase subunit